MNAKFIIILFFLINIVTYVSSYCFIDIDLIPKDDGPIYIKNGKLHNPEKINIATNSIIALKWDLGEIGLLFCGNLNSIENLMKSEITFKCTSNNTIIDTITKKEIDLKNMKCSKTVTTIVKNINRTCDFGNILKIGFENRNDFYEYIEICYNFEIGSTKYTKHIIAGKARQKVTNSSKIDTFKRSIFYRDGLPYYTRDGDPYKKASQISRFGKIMQYQGSNETAFNNNNLFLAVGHLTPVNDGVFNYLKRATMFYINAAPEWQTVNAGNWIRVENIARCQALSLNDDLEVITGIAGILELPENNTNISTMLYLKTIQINNTIIKKPTNKRMKLDNIPVETKEDIIPVPKYFWKVLKYQDKSIAFITLNNPYAGNQSNVTDPCNDICDKYGYSSNSITDKGFNNFDKGRTYCCQVNDLATKFPNDVPKELRQLSGNILKNSQSC